MFRKWLSVLLVLMMLVGVFSILPLSASAEDAVVSAVPEESQDDGADVGVVSAIEPDTTKQEELLREKEDSELAAVGAEADVAEEGAEIDAADTGTLYSGSTGDCTWLFDDANGTLTISGSGSTANYSNSTPEYFKQFRYKITKIIINNGVKTIGVSAFSGLPNLASVSIPPSVTKIGDDAFTDKSLKRVDISDLRAWLKIEFSSTSRVFYNGGCGLYLNNQLLTKLNVPQGLTYIPSYAFQNYDSLQSVTIPSSVSYIGKDAFVNCHGITSVTFGGGATIDEGAFFDCLNMKTVSFAKSGTTDIHKKAFHSCSHLQSLYLPGNVKYIEEEAFSSCKDLRSVTIDYGLTFIGKAAFRECESLKSIVIPDSVTSGIKVETFWGCTSLERAVIGNRVPSIAGSSFGYCTSLKELVIGSSVETIYYRAVVNCVNLNYVVIPPTVKKIYDEAFGFYYDPKAGHSQGVLIIFGDNGTEAQRYANKYGFSFLDRSLAPGATSPAVKPLATPRITGCESLDSGVKIKWNAVSGAEKYRVFYKLSNGSWRKMYDTANTYVVNPGVTSGATYTFTVRCINSAATAYTSGYNKTGYRYTYNMATPSIKGFSNTSTGVTISIGTVANAKKYRVFYKQGGKWTKLGDTTSSTFTHSGAALGKSYSYTVRCLKSDGSRYTSAYNTTGWKHVRKLSTPRITGCDSLDNGVKIKWGKVSGAEKYRVFYKSSNGSWSKMYDTANTYVINPGVKSGATYTFTVRCINSAATAFTSDYDNTGYRYTYNMATPTITGFSDSASGVNITIGTVANAKKYRIFYKNGGTWTKLGDTTTSTFLHKNAVFGRNYTYTVRCLKSDGSKFLSAYNNTGWSHWHYLKTPEISSFVSTGTGVRINWSAVPNAEKYAVYYKVNGKWTRMGVTAETTYIHKGAVRGTEYTYTVRCINNALNISTSDFNDKGWSYTYKSGTGEVYPKITSVSMDSAGDLRVEINDDTDTASYVSYYGVYVWNNSKWQYVGSVKKGYRWILEPNLTAVKSYYFTVIGYDHDNNAVTDYNANGFYLAVQTI